VETKERRPRPSAEIFRKLAHYKIIADENANTVLDELLID